MKTVRTSTTRRFAVTVSVLGALFGACAAEPANPSGSAEGGDPSGKSDASIEAVFLTFKFDGDLVADWIWDTSNVIEDQLLYTIGHLNGDRSLARLDKVELTNIQRTDLPDGRVQLRYHASLPVAWGKKDSVPTEYRLRLPREVSSSGFERFTEAHKATCVDWSAHGVTADSMWYYYRPNAPGCTLAPEEVFDTVATVTRSGTQTTGKYPEYHQVWADGVLRVVAIFGKYEDGATAASDAGIAAYNRFNVMVRELLGHANLATVPANAPVDPGVAFPDVLFSGDFGDGRRVEVATLLVDSIRSAGPDFDARYGELSSQADIIAYNGHSGLGANIRALAAKGRWVAGQYVVVFMNGCDTYAYVDSALARAHADVNTDDPNGTRYMDILTNAMPAYFAADAPDTMALINGLLARSSPKTFEQIFARIDSSQVVLVTGEEDNVYFPGYEPGPGPEPEPWAGLEASGTVVQSQEKRFETPALAAGRYFFEIDGSGDSDLYVRIGAAPTTDLYDCRPYDADSTETCTVDIAQPAPIHIMVRGYAATSTFTLHGRGPIP